MKPARRSAEAGLDVVAIIVAGQEGDGHIRARTKIIPQFLQLMPREETSTEADGSSAVSLSEEA